VDGSLDATLFEDQGFSAHLGQPLPAARVRPSATTYTNVPPSKPLFVGFYGQWWVPAAVAQ
jgi:hypothetical protein